MRFEAPSNMTHFERHRLLRDRRRNLQETIRRARAKLAEVERELRSFEGPSS